MIRLCLILFALLGRPVHAQGWEDFRSYGPSEAPERLRIRGTTDLSLFDPVLRAFSATNPDLRIDYQQWGSNALYAQASLDCRGGDDSADLLISSSIDQQVKLANDGCAHPYRSALTDKLPAIANWRDEVFATTHEPAVILYNNRLVRPEEAPRSRFDLIDLLRPEHSRFRGRVATYDIESAGVGYLFAFADAQQATTFGSLLEAMGRGGAVTHCCSSGIIDGVERGRFLVAYNVLGSYAIARAQKNPHLTVVAPHDYTLVLARAALIPKQSSASQAAGRFIDFLLSTEGRAILRSVQLIVDTTPREDPQILLPAQPETLLRQIPLSPSLLVGLDQHKRARFIARWRQNFRPAR